MGGGIRVGIFGAGAVGAWLGVLLSGQGLPVVMVGRPWLVALAGELEARSIGGRVHRPGPDLVVDDDPAALGGVDLCLVTVKSRHTDEAAAALSKVLRPGTPVCSFQNGLRNPDRLRAGGLEPVLGGMFSTNVFRQGPRFVQATSGPLTLDARGLQRCPAPIEALRAALEGAGEALDLRSDIQAVQAGKLLINLNNALCALSGLSIAESLRSRPLRRSFAASILEGQRVLRAAGVAAARVGKLSPGLMARLLPLPDALILRAAPALVSIDPAARSSTLQDLEAGKPTEIDDLNGEIVRLAAEVGAKAPVHAWIVAEIRRLEAAGLPVPFLSPEAIEAAIAARRLR